MNLKICWFYHDILDLYGDTGNIMVLQKRCEDRGIQVEIDTIGMHEPCDISNYDLFFMGGGADHEQELIHQDLLSRKKMIEKAYQSQTFFFLICGAYQLFGQSYIDSNHVKLQGLGMGSYYTVAADKEKRCIGNCMIDATLDEHIVQLVGFENHGGQTLQVEKPLGKVICGHGNEYQGVDEGYYDGTMLGTYIHGPILPKNPELADFIIYKALLKRKQIESFESLEKLNDTLELEAKNSMIKRLLKQS